VDLAVAICACVGSWLLVAGAVYQAALELADEEFDRRQIVDVASALPKPKRVSAWWWLMPPVAYVLKLRRANLHRERVMAALDPIQRQQTVSFFNKSGGWLIVATGAYLLAVVATWQMDEALDWPGAAVWLIVAVATIACIGYTVRQMLRTQRLLARVDASNVGRARPHD